MKEDAKFMNSMKRSLIALCGVFACVGVTSAEAGDDFTDVSAAFSAEVTAVNDQYFAVTKNLGIAMANNGEIAALNLVVDSSLMKAVDDILLMSDTTGNSSIDNLVIDYKLAAMDYEKAVKSMANSIGGSVHFDSASVSQEVINAVVVYNDALGTIMAARDAAKITLTQEVTGVSQERIDGAQDLLDFGTMTTDQYEALEVKEELQVLNGDNPEQDIPITAEVVENIKNKDVSSDAVSWGFAPGDLYEGSSEVRLTKDDIIDIRNAYEANTKVAFYEANGSQEITAAHIAAAETLITGGVIRDVTQADIDTATDLVLAGSINQSQIDTASRKFARGVITDTEITAAETANDALIEAGKSKNIAGTTAVEDDVGFSIWNDKIAIGKIKTAAILADPDNSIDAADADYKQRVFLTESLLDEAQAVIDDDDLGNDVSVIIGENFSITKADAEKIVAAGNRFQLIEEGLVNAEELVEAEETAARTVVTRQDLINARALIKAGTKEVLTQAEFDAAQILVADMGVVQEVLDAAVEAQNAVLEAIKNSDDKALKSALKALESTVVSVKNVLDANKRVTDAIAAVKAGTMSARAFDEKIKPDAGVAMTGAMSGVTVVNSTISNHQNAMVASSGKYGLSRHSGVNAGSTPLNMGVWMKAFGSDSEMDMRDSVAGYDADTQGIVIGIDRIIGDDIMVGLALSYADINVEGKSTAASVTDTEQVQGTLYGMLFMNDFFVSGSVAYAQSGSDTERTGFGGAVTAEYDTSTYSASLGAGMPIDMGSYGIIPQITMAYSYVNPDSYTESGFGALNVEPDSMELFGVKAGVTINKTLLFDSGSLTPSLRLIADWDVLQAKAEVNSSWVSTGTTITPTTGAEPAALGAIIGAGIDYATDDGIYVVSLDYDLSTRSDFVSHAGSVKARINF